MSEQTPPYPYFNGIIYNQSLFTGTSGQYLPRTGVATSVATSTTFNGLVYTSGLNDSTTINASNLSVSGTLTLPNNSIPDSSLSTNVALLNANETFSGTVSFSNPPYMSGTNITSRTIPDGALSTNVMLLTGTQSISGTKNFSSRMGTNGISDSATISGLNLFMTGTITLPNNSISDSALSTNVALLNANETFSGTVSFSNPPYMSGTNITSRTIPDGALSTNVVLLTGTQSISGTKNFSSRMGTNGISDSATISGLNLFMTGTITLPNNSISDSALSTNVALLNANNTFTGTNTFSNPPYMSGTNITTNSIPTTAINGTIITANANNTFTGTNTFSNAINADITGTATNSTNSAIGAPFLGSYYLTFVSGTSGNLPLLAKNTLVYTPSTNSLAVSSISGYANSEKINTLVSGGATSYYYPTFSNNTTSTTSGSINNTANFKYDIGSDTLYLQAININQPITPIYTSLPSFTSSQIGYIITQAIPTNSTLNTTVNTFATITSLPIGVWIFTANIGGPGSGAQVGIYLTLYAGTTLLAQFNGWGAPSLSSLYANGTYTYANSVVQNIVLKAQIQAGSSPNMNGYLTAIRIA